MSWIEHFISSQLFVRLKLSSVIYVFLSGFLLAVISSCVELKPFQKGYLSDDDMQLNSREIEGADLEIETYREGASGASGGNSGGGCGCY